MNVNDVYVLMQYIINKNQQGYLSPADFFNIINQAQRSYISYLLGSLQKYQYGKATAPVELGNSMTLRQILSPVITETTLNINVDGTSSYPADFVLTDAMWTFNGFNRIRAVEQDKLYSFYNSQIDPIANWPIYLIKENGFQFYPENLSVAKLSYVKNAPNIIWAYVLDGNNRPIYSAQGPNIATTAVSNAQWTGTGYAGGYLHSNTSGTLPLISTFNAEPGKYYELVLNLNSGNTGYVTLSFGGNISGILSTSGPSTVTLSGYATTNDPFVITPYDTFNGEISAAIYQSSRDPVWGDTTILDIVSRALMMVGVNLQANQILSYANEIKKQGQ